MTRISPHPTRSESIRLVLLGVMVASGLCTLSLLMLPLLLAGLMLLFDRSAQAVLVLFGLLSDWWRSLFAGGAGGGLPSYPGLVLAPGHAVLVALPGVLLCLGGLLSILLHPSRREADGVVTLLWAAALLWCVAMHAGLAVVATLLPGVLASGLRQLIRA